MRGTEIAARLQRHGLRIFTTSDVRILSRLHGAATTHALRRLARAGLVVRLKRGVWGLRMAPGLGPFEAVAHLAAPWPASISLHSALAHYGLIAEIPHVISAVSAGPTRTWRTELGTVHIHHLAPMRMFGSSMTREGEARFLIADREKAFLDTLYLSLIPRSPIHMAPRRAGRWPLDRERLIRYARRFDYPPLLHRLKEMHLG